VRRSFWPTHVRQAAAATVAVQTSLLSAPFSTNFTNNLDSNRTYHRLVQCLLVTAYIAAETRNFLPKTMNKNNSIKSLLPKPPKLQPSRITSPKLRWQINLKPLINPSPNLPHCARVKPSRITSPKLRWQINLKPLINPSPNLPHWARVKPEIRETISSLNPS
jgi:hypothetical protein